MWELGIARLPCFVSFLVSCILLRILPPRMRAATSAGENCTILRIPPRRSAWHGPRRQYVQTAAGTARSWLHGCVGWHDILPLAPTLQRIGALT